MTKVSEILKALVELQTALRAYTKGTTLLSAERVVATGVKGGYEAALAGGISVTGVDIPGAVGKTADAGGHAVHVHRNVLRALDPERSEDAE
jgi:hypothetical protein